MKNILKDVYNGYMRELNEPDEPYVYPHGYKAAEAKVCKAEDEICKGFPDCKKLFREYQDANAELTDAISYHNFEIGFRVGALLMLEVLCPNDTEG